MSCSAHLIGRPPGASVAGQKEKLSLSQQRNSKTKTDSFELLIIFGQVLALRNPFLSFPFIFKPLESTVANNLLSARMKQSF